MGLVLGLVAPAPALAAFDTVVIDPVKTSIYIGNVTLKTTPFRRTQARFSADYKARVIPFFFHNEQGSLWVELSDEQLERLHRGERVHFSGEAENEKKEPRRIEGHATPTAPGSPTGRIKVRVFVTPKIELIFNSSYRFE